MVHSLSLPVCSEVQLWGVGLFEHATSELGLCKRFYRHPDQSEWR
jgi:hypothetical protein